MQDLKNVFYLASIDSLSNALAYVNFAEILDYQPKAKDPQKQIAEYLHNKTQIKNSETLYRKQSYKDTWVNLVKDLDTGQTYFILDNTSGDFENQMGMISVPQE